MQHDMFEPKEVSRVKSLQYKREALQHELNEVTREIREAISGGKTYFLGGKLWLSQQPSGALIAYTPLEGSQDRNTAFFSVVSIDLLAKAVEHLKQETHYAPKGILTDHGSESSHRPW